MNTFMIMEWLFQVVARISVCTLYKAVESNDDIHYCFGVGNLTAKCLEAPEHGESVIA